MSLALRPACIEDFRVIASWVTDAHACSRWAGPSVPFPFNYSDLPALLEATLESAFCLGDAGDPVAFGQVRLTGDASAHLARVIVCPIHRRRGFGGLLCEMLVTHATQALGAAIVTLRVYDDNRQAMELYARLGFLPVGASDRSGIVLMERRPNISVNANASERAHGL